MKYFILIIFIFIALEGNTQHSEKAIIFFETEQWQLTKEHKNFIDSLLNNRSRKQISIISIHGHTDNIGYSLYNMKLSEKRSNSVADYFKLILDDNQKIRINYHGENNPTTNNLDPKNRTLNRRVEIVFSLTDKNDAEAYINDLEELYKLISPTPQEFCIQNNSDTVIVGEEGTLIYIKANSFKTSSDPSKCIKIKLSERYRKSQIILDNLSTIMNHKILVSQAMFEIDYDKSLNSPNGIIMFTPSDAIIPEILPFKGIRDDEDNMHWHQTNEEVDNISGASINNFLNEICIAFSIKIDTLDTKCPLFFCKILNGLRIRKFEPFTQTTINDTIPCPVPSDIQSLNHLGTLNLDQLKDIPNDSLKYYVFNITRLGWYNLDWLLKYDDSIDYKVRVDPEKNLDVKLVFKEYRSVIPLIPENGYYHLPDAPLNCEAWLFAFKVQNGKAYLAIEDVTINENGINNLNLETVSIKELYNKLKVFD